MPLSSSNEKRSTVLLIDSDGASYYTCYFARGLSKYRDVILYSFSEELYTITGADKANGIKFHFIKKLLPKGYSTIKGIIRVFLLFFILFVVLVRTNYDIVHIQEHLPTFFLFIPILKLRRKKIFWTLHDVDIYKTASGVTGNLQLVFLSMVAQPFIMTRFVDKIIVHAFSLKDHLITKGVDQNKIHVIHHFDYRYLLECENNTFTKSKDPIIGQNYVLFFGSIAPWKGIDTLVNAAKIVRNKMGEKFSLVIAGTPYEGYKNVPFFENLMKEDYEFIKIINKYISSSEIPRLIRESAFLVLPYRDSFRYSASGVIPLAYTFSKPVVVSNVRSLSEYVEHGKTGLVFESDNTEELANCIIELIKNGELCVDMGHKANDKLQKEMSLDLYSKTIDTLYQNA